MRRKPEICAGRQEKSVYETPQIKVMKHKFEELERLKWVSRQ